MTWFQQGQKIADFKPEAKKSKVTAGYPFSLKPGEDAKIAILNPDNDPPPVLHCHMVPDPDPDKSKILHRVVSALPESDYCHWNEYVKTVPEASQWRWKMKKFSCFSILDLREQKDKEGKVYPAQKKLRLTQDTQMEDIQKIYHIIENDLDHITSLQYAVLAVSRSTQDKSAAIGDIKQVLKMLDTSAYDPETLTPMTEEEIMSHFVFPGTPEYQRLVDAYPIKEAVSTTVKKKKV